MSVMTVTTRITHKYLMNKSKSELSYMILDMLDDQEKFESKIAELNRQLEMARNGIPASWIPRLIDQQDGKLE